VYVYNFFIYNFLIIMKRTLLKEKAAQRAKELQREEEERIREQRAKALAKLEELNRRATPQKEPVHKESEPTPPLSDSRIQLEPSDIITAATHLQEVAQKSAEISSIATVTLSFGTISEVQITTGAVTHISEVPISSMKTSADASAILGALGSGSGADTGAGAVFTAGFGTSSHARHHHGKQLGYKRMHNDNLNASPKLRTSEKMTNMENPTEPLKQTEAQVSVSESTQHKDDTVAHQHKRGNRNPKSRIKTEVPAPVPVSVPAQSVAPLEARPGKELNDKIQIGSSTASTSENSNSVPPEDSGKEVSKLHEVESCSAGGNNRAGPHWKAQQQRRPVRNNRTSSDKSHNNETVMWAPVKQLKEENTNSSGTSAAMDAPKIDGEVHSGVKTKRAEIERYVPKPQLSQQDKKPDESTDVKAGEILPPSEAKAEEADSRTIIGSNSTNNLNKSMRHSGRPHASWRQRVGPVEMHETIFHNPTDGEKTLTSDTHLAMPFPSPRDYEDSNPDGRPRRHNGHKLYKATGSNYIGHGAIRSETENIGEIVDGAITIIEGKSENVEPGSCEVLNYSSNTRSQHWKPKSQSHAYPHGKGSVGWQKVVYDKVGPISGKCQDEDKPVTYTPDEDFGSAAPRRQHGNAQQYKAGTSHEREINKDSQPVVGSYQRVTGEDGMEGGNRVASGSRYRGRGRNGHFARRASELST
jgi:hypothetical protein